MSSSYVIRLPSVLTRVLDAHTFPVLGANLLRLLNLASV